MHIHLEHRKHLYYRRPRKRRCLDQDVPQSTLQRADVCGISSPNPDGSLNPDPPWKDSKIPGDTSHFIEGEGKSGNLEFVKQLRTIQSL